MRAEDVKHVGIVSSTERDNKAGTEGDNGVDIKGDNKAGIGGNDKLGIIEPDDKSGSGRQDNKPDTKRQDNKPGIRGQNSNRVGNIIHDDGVGTRRRGNKGAAKPAARAFYIGAQRLSCRDFLLATHSDIFLAFLSSESVISRISPSSSSIANFALSVMLTNRVIPSLRYPKIKW